MTQGPEGNEPPQYPQYGQPAPPTQPYGQQPYGQQPPPYQQPYQAPYAAPGQAYGVAPVPGAPYGVHPGTGVPYSDKSKLVAGLLQILIPLGIGRFYIGDTKTGVWQLLVTIFTCGIGSLWPFIDGIMILVKDDPRDINGYVLKS